jgi:hypothetical protein
MLVGSGCLLSAQAPAAPNPATFELTIRATAFHQWTHTAAPVVTGACTRTETSEGIRTTQFRTLTPARVRLVSGRVLATQIRSLTGTVTLAGANTTDERCGNEGTGKIADCVRTRRSFSNARVSLSSPRPGYVDIGVPRNVALRRSDCPIEPDAVRRRPLGPEVSVLRLPDEVLTQQRVVRITLRASRERRTDYLQPEDGSLLARSEWHLTFVRVKA